MLCLLEVYSSQLANISLESLRRQDTLTHMQDTMRRPLAFEHLVISGEGSRPKALKGPS